MTREHFKGHNLHFELTTVSGESLSNLNCFIAALEKSLTMKLDDVRQQFVQSKLVLALREYQNIFGVQHALTGRLIYPESLKLLPLYCLSLSKCLALRGGNTGATLDERLYASFEMMIMSVPRLLNFLYPTMFRFDDWLIKVLESTTSISLKSDSE